MNKTAIGLAVLLTLSMTWCEQSQAQGNRPPINRKDSLALVALYEATDGLNWVSTRDYCPGARCWLEANTWARNWIGIYFAGDLSDRVQEVRLPQNNLVGAIPEEIGDLDELVRLKLWGNSISGAIPGSISKLRKLEHLELDDNLITDIPDGLYDLPALKTLSLAGNELRGPLPTRPVDLQALEHLYLSGNAFEGPIPEKYSEFPVLKTLALDDNDLTGEIPRSLRRLAQLETLGLSNNSFEGWMSRLIDRLPPKLTNLFLQNNQLTGTILGFGYSRWFPGGGFPETLENLDLSGNEFFGVAPSSLARMRHVKLHNNKLWGIEKLDLTKHPAAALQSLTVFSNELNFDEIFDGWSWMRDEYYDGYVYHIQSDISGLRPAKVAREQETAAFYDDVMTGPRSSLVVDRQWLRNGMPIAGETGGSLEIGPVSRQDHLAAFSLRATSSSAEGVTLQSTATRLLVVDSKFQHPNLAIVTAADPACSIFLRRFNASLPIRNGDVLFAEDEIHTRCGKLRIALGRRNDIVIDPHSKVLIRNLYAVETSITALAAGVRAGKLIASHVESEDGKTRSDATLHTIDTPNARIAASGAHFSVSSDTIAGTTQVVVTKGEAGVVFDTTTTTSKVHYSTTDSLKLSEWQMVTVTNDGLQPIEDFAISELQISPDTVTLFAGDDWRFTAIGSDDAGREGAVAVDWASPGGTFHPNGYFVAGNTPGAHLVTASEPRFGLEATAVVVVEMPVGTVAEGTPESAGFHLGVPYPNPFHRSVNIPFSVDRSDVVRLMAYDLLGRKVGVLFNEVATPGGREVVWDARSSKGSDLPNGVYVLVLDSASGHHSRKILLMR